MNVLIWKGSPDYNDPDSILTADTEHATYSVQTVDDGLKNPVKLTVSYKDEQESQTVYRLSNYSQAYAIAESLDEGLTTSKISGTVST